MPASGPQEQMSLAPEENAVQLGTVMRHGTSISKHSRIVIAGAGIGGLASALALQQRGFNPVVCERSPELTAVGAGLLLSPNGVRALELLGLREKAFSVSRIVREWRILSRDGRCLQKMRPGRDDLPALSLHRADLQFLFLNEVSKESLRLGSEVCGYRQDEALAVTLVSGETLAVDALIGADGLRSAVRAGRFGPHAPRYAGYVGWRGVCPWIPLDYQGDHLSESWSEGMRFGISPMGNGRCYWYATANRPAGKLTSTGDRRSELMRLFGRWHAPVSSLIEGTPAESIIATDIHDRPAQHPWSEGAVTLLGDAAHPMTPNLGQGACFALEDAWVIARCIESSSDFRSAFETYEKARRSRADAIQRRSYWLGKLIQLESPATTALRDLALRLTPNRIADLSMRSLFSFKP